jgi:hypothetical protein
MTVQQHQGPHGEGDQEPLADDPGTPASVAVRVPRRNLLTPDVLRGLVAGDLEPGGRP